MKAKKALALILVLVMVLGLLTVTASADTVGSLGSPTNGIKSITISGANINNNEDRTLTGSSAPYNLTYNVKLASGTADGTVVTATFEKENASNENLVVSSAKPNSILNAVSRKHIKKHASLTYNATVQNGTATMTVYVYPNLADSVKSYGTYVINFQLADVNNPITVNGTQIRFGDPAYPMTEPERYMSFEAAGTNAYNAVYAGPTAGFVPDLYSLYLKSDAALTLTSNSTDIVFRTYDANGNMTETNTVTGTSGTGYFSTVIYAKAAGSIQVATAGSTTATTINFSAPNDPSAVHNAQLHPEGATAYLPGLTQYANRGDWGSISAGGDNLLDPANKIKGYYGFAANGFSLGSLGGYVQYDFHSNPIANIGKAEDVTTATAAKTAALEAMAAVDADMAQDYGTVYVTIENTTFTHDLWPTGKTYWEGTPINHFEVDLTAASTMMTCVVDALDVHGWSQTGASSNYISSINGLSAFDGGSQSGWMGTLNDWFTNEGFGNFSVANGKLGDGDEIRIMYTRTGYGEDLGGTWSNQNTTLEALDVTNGTIFPDFTSGTIGSTNEYTLQIDDEKAEIKITPTAANKNFLVKTFLNEQVTDNTEGVSFYKRTQTIPVVAGDTIYVGCGVKGWPTMNAQAGNTQTSNGTWYVLKVVNAQVDDGSAYVMGLIDKYCVKVESYNYKSMENGLSITRAAYDALSDTSKQNVTNYQKLVDAENGVASFKKTADLSVKIAALSSVYRATLEDVEAVKSVQEIYESLTQEEKDRLTVNEYNKLMALIEKIDGLNQAAADKVIADIAAIGPIDEITLESAEQIQKARAGYDALNKYAQYIVKCAEPVNYYTLLDAEAKLKELQDAAAEQERIDRAAAAAVDSLIDEIGDVTLDSKQAIETARAAYDNLTPTQKTYVTKLNTLTAAEAAYKALVDRKAADDVTEKINEIGKVTLESKTAIEAARAAYNALTDDQKPLVENYDVLTAAEAELARLEAEAKDKADREAAAQVDEMIERLFPVNRYSGPAIRMARAAYEALTEDQKALVKHYDDLVKAEAEFAAIPPITPVGPSKPSKPSTPDTSKDNLPFTDVVSGSWYYDGVKYACDNGLMNGTGANAFNPNADTTRSMIVTILARMEGVNTSGGATWYTAGRAWAMENGISDGTNMEGKITREQLAAMLYRYAKMKGYDVSASASLSGYTDASSVSGWAKEAMQWAVGSGLIQGSGNALTPQANASRAQIATILMRFAQSIAK